MDVIPLWLQQLLIVVIIPFLVQGVKLLCDKFGWGEAVKRGIVIGFAVALSLGGGLLYFAPELPAWSGDPIAFINALISVAGPFFMGVQVIYNFILKHAFERAGWV